MNRAEQLIAALDSCVHSMLPKEVEFVIVDNASTDNTKDIVNDFFARNEFPYKYEYENVNLGVGGGRNRGFALAEGDFVYFLDDDAVVAEDSYDSFFIKPLEIFKTDSRIASITTRIYDELLECDRDVRISRNSKNNTVPDILMFLGGSHFLRKAYYSEPLYLNIKYGMEEILPSVKTIDMGRRNCYISDVTLLHQPRRNKWLPNTDEAKNLAIDYNVNMYCAKKLLYPWYMQPALWCAFWIRNIKHLGCDFSLLRKVYETYKRQISHRISVTKISFNTILNIARDYSLSALI